MNLKFEKTAANIHRQFSNIIYLTFNNSLLLHIRYMMVTSNNNKNQKSNGKKKRIVREYQSNNDELEESK